MQTAVTLTETAAHLDVVEDSEQRLPNFCQMINEVVSLAAANQVI